MEPTTRTGTRSGYGMGAGDVNRRIAMDGAQRIRVADNAGRLTSPRRMPPEAKRPAMDGKRWNDFQWRWPEAARVKVFG
jgi:hypothetical protein